MEENKKIVFNEILNKEIIDLGIKNPQYKKEYYLLYWEVFWNLFEKKFSKWFEFNKPDNFSNRVIHLETENKSDKEKTLFILSLSEGHMETTKGKLLTRLRFMNSLVKQYIKENQSIFYISFYAPLKAKNKNFQEIFDSTDFKKTILVFSTLQEIWNSSEKYGERYNSILYNKPFKKQEWISMEINYNKILFFLNDKKADLKENIIKFENGKIINKNQEGFRKIKKENISYSLIKLDYIDNCIDELIKKNHDFIKWINFSKSSNNDLNIETKNNSFFESKHEEKWIEVKQRIGQEKFKKDLVKEYKKCIISNISFKPLLEGCHIRPWSDSELNKERLDVNNGILLTRNFHKLFDDGFITFSDEGKLILSKLLDYETVDKLGIEHGRQYNLKLNPERKKYMRYHRENIFDKKGKK